MSAPPVRPRRPGRAFSVLLLALFAGTAGLFATTSGLPLIEGLAVALAGVGGSAVLRPRLDGARSPYAVVPALGALAVLAAAAPNSPLAELFGGVAALTLLAWLADDPRRSPGGVVRAAPSLLLVALTLGIAWMSALFLPTGSARVGFGAALLVLVTILVAILLGRPELIDREPPATA